MVYIYPCSGLPTEPLKPKERYFGSDKGKSPWRIPPRKQYKGTRSVIHTNNERTYLDLCRYRCNMPAVNTPLEELRRMSGMYEYDQLVRSEMIPDAVLDVLEDRLIMGAFRYGRIGEPGKKQWDRIGSVLERLSAYEGKHNQEHLFDAINLLVLELLEPPEGAFFEAADDGIHTEEKP